LSNLFSHFLPYSPVSVSWDLILFRFFRLFFFQDSAEL